MRHALAAVFITVAALGCDGVEPADVKKQDGYQQGNRYDMALLERRTNERLNAIELHLSQRLERIERDTARLRGGVR